ncbi:hypothetical protein [Planktothricoides raciborskii]|uniref:Uncharacterized protein n=1 Tax=Planktothricoides raciborskii GIHE-MW2 TaxID=2792601 RepID=A0AAU8J5Z3_9CYAN|nr:hypothetical protein [Planktothricoides raciborskii]
MGSGAIWRDRERSRVDLGGYWGDIGTILGRYWGAIAEMNEKNC